MNFAFVWVSFQNARPGMKTKPSDENAKWTLKNTSCRRKKSQEERQKLDKNENAARKKTDGKRKSETNRKTKAERKQTETVTKKA